MSLTVLDCPPIVGGYYKFGEEYRLGRNGVFTFGSNERGAHGIGAALTAAKVYGAKYGLGEGPTSIMRRDGKMVMRTYAIPTKDKELRVRPLKDINSSVDRLKLMMDMNTLDIDPYWFYITPIGTGLAGYRHKDIVPMFVEGTSYCWFPDIWEKYLGDLNQPEKDRAKALEALLTQK